MRFWRHVICAAILAGSATGAMAVEVWQTEPLVKAQYSEPTTRYPHAALGDDVEYGALDLTYRGQARFTIQLPKSRVFEDVAPRMVDVDGDGLREAIVVESHQDKGARLAIYNGGGLVAATPYIGRRFRWLAPVGAADLDGDGHVEIAYVDRPHLAKTLRIVRFKDGKLTPVAALKGVTNHQIGQRDIAGGIRTCAGLAEMIVARADWRALVSVTLQDGQLTMIEIGPHQGRTSFAAALNCE